MVTKKFEFQTKQLTAADFQQAILAMLALKGCFFYNCGPQSGFSQKHKHIQIFPEEALKLPIMEQLISITKGGNNPLFDHINYKGKKVMLFKGYEFIHGMIIIEPSSCLSTMG